MTSVRAQMPHILTSLGATAIHTRPVAIERLMGALSTIIEPWDIESVKIKSSLRSHSITLLLTDGTKHTVRGVKVKDAERVREDIYLMAREQASLLERNLTRVRQNLPLILSPQKYIRHRKAQDIHFNIRFVLTRARGIVGDQLSDEQSELLDSLAHLKSPEVFSAEVESINAQRVSSNIPKIITAVRLTSGITLTEEQAAAIASNEETNILRAGAGTGKTSTIIGKVTHLIENQAVTPNEILILAFNRKAAQEIRGRLNPLADSLNIHTFHSFGRMVLGEALSAIPTISSMSTDNARYISTIKDILSKIASDPEQAPDLIEFLSYHHRGETSPFDFDSRTAYESAIRAQRLRSLNGDLVKSHEELLIANFLVSSGIRFTYEGDYERPTATSKYRQYQPDFYLPEQGIYLEHFALDRKGNPPPDWKNYAAGVEWKRKTHRKYDTRLIETHSWRRQNGTLLSSLEKDLRAYHVTFNPIHPEQLAPQLPPERLTPLITLMSTFLNHARGANLSDAELRQNAARLDQPTRARAFLDLFRHLRNRYEDALAAESAVDFHHLVNLATHHIFRGGWTSPYRHILVDEFQDISASRLDLLSALRTPDTSYMLVGDDWQSIYRFAGSDISLMNSCGSRLGYVKEMSLTRTFRFGQSINAPSNRFITKNPDQSQRQMIPSPDPPDHGITVIAIDEPREAVSVALSEIHDKTGGQDATVLILGRYRSDLEKLQKTPATRHFPRLSIELSTIHSAKGKEADYVIICGLTTAGWGFPSTIEDDPLLDLALPPRPDSQTHHAEERRVMYVALTRARAGTYLITNRRTTSPFALELLSDPSVRQLGDIETRCPECKTGYLSHIASKHGPFMGCSEYSSRPRCLYTRTRGG